jgi:hypothetical protein
VVTKLGNKKNFLKGDDKVRKIKKIFYKKGRNKKKFLNG